MEKRAGHGQGIYIYIYINHGGWDTMNKLRVVEVKIRRQKSGHTNLVNCAMKSTCLNCNKVIKYLQV